MISSISDMFFIIIINISVLKYEYIYDLSVSLQNTKKKNHTQEYTQLDTHVARLNLKELYIHKSSKTLSFLPLNLSTLLTMNYMYIYMYIYVYLCIYKFISLLND